MADLRFCLARLILISIALWAFVPHAAAATVEPVRIALTDAMFTDEPQTRAQWADYLGRKLQRPVLFVERRTYNDVQQLIRLGEVDFAWICGLPYVLGARQHFMRYVATPEFNGGVTYRIYVIAAAGRQDVDAKSLRGRIFAFSDPDSVSFRALVAGAVHPVEPIDDLNRYFSVYFFTSNHADTIHAVADGVADAGSVDGQIWDIMAQTEPQTVRRTRVIARSEHYGLPPIVAAAHVSDALLAQMRDGLIAMSADSEGKRILARLRIDGFGVYPDALYDSIRRGPALDAIGVGSSMRAE